MIYGIGIDSKYTIVYTHKCITVITNEPLDLTKFFSLSSDRDDKNINK